MDYYSILGVPRNASQDDIRKAYKKKSMLHHPDRGGDEAKFKEVNEAYSTLKDPAKKQQYDNPQPQYKFNTGNMHRGGFEDMFAQFGFGQQMNRQRRNRDVRIVYNIDFKDIFTGKAISVSYKLASGKDEFLDASLPPGLKNGDNITFANLGDDSFPHLPRGNLILKVKVPGHPIWKRDGDNLSTTIKLDVFNLILGTEIEIETPTGKALSLTVPKGTKPNTTFSIAGHGAPNVNTSKLGNLYVKIEGVVPNITDENILKQIKDIKDEIS